MTPILSVIIPVFEEAGTIHRTLSCLVAETSRFRAETIIVDGDPQGSTISVIKPRSLTTLVGPKGRGPQMNAGARVARGTLLLFLHADTLLPRGALRAATRTCARPGIAGGAFSLGIDHLGQIFRWIEVTANLRARLTRIPYGDQAIFLRRAVFESMGGFKEIPIMEDIDLMQRLKRAGHRVAILPERVRTSPRRWETEGPVFCTIRNTLLSTLYFSGIPAEQLKRFYP